MPFTAASETVRSTAFKASFAASTVDFCARNAVEKEALGAKRSVRRVVVDVRVRNDMVVIYLLVYEEKEVIACFYEELIDAEALFTI